MPFRFSWISAALALIALPIPFARAMDQVTIEWQITPPGKLPTDAEIHVCGNLPQLGNWDGKGILATRQPAGIYSAKLLLPKGTDVEYKITQGSWQTVEKSAAGDEIENRTLTADADKTVSITVASFAAGQASATQPTTRSTITGDVRYHLAFHSDILHNDRTILVWLPPDYETNATHRYPVLYLHDGQNCFDAATSFAGEWHADETAGDLIRSRKIPSLIMVAVYNVGEARIEEYTPTRSTTGQTANRGGSGEKYAQFLIQELKPMIDRTYRTLPDRTHTAIAGSSLGGLSSLYIGLNHGDVFGLIAAISPSLWWDDRYIIKQIEANPTKLKAERIWLDAGTAESSDPDEAKGTLINARALAASLHQSFPDGKSFKYLEIPGAKHNEQAWSARFGQVLEFLFG